MRRILSAVLLSVVTVVVLATPPAGADAAKEPPRRTAPALAGAAVPHSVSLRSTLTTSVVHQRRPLADPVLTPTALQAQTTVGALRAEWQHVAVCEVGGNWKMTGPSYSGIGFSNSTWDSYGGRRFAPLAGLATEDQQIVIGMKVTGGWVPDQNGCNPGGW
jgi:hypothetical protein